MKQAMEDDDDLGALIFRDEVTFHLSGKVNRHIVRVWGTELPHVIVKQERDSPKVNVFCAISKRKLYGPFFFIEQAVTGFAYLDMLQLLLFPQLTPRLSTGRGSTSLEHNCPLLNRELPHRCIVRAGLLVWMMFLCCQGPQI
ncbi:hypothetical protein AVEN_183577-1 [Araneus ventricosus]|uniref:Uncharacterized protein n=1 Tax=Araneus ventricosus TaxID=182803 RepID=A0A4Y2H0Q6_ARAVE|nr:hypothetical protein AVEN_183577-1 [Araneus ventricosus]